MTHRDQRSVRAVISALAFALAASLALACHDPYADVRARLSPADLERFDSGARVALPCATCHDLAGRTTKIGPHLSGLAGRRAGGLPGFAYSKAMSRSGLVWDADTLDAFLASPQTVVPGNRMVSPGVSDHASRADLVFFLIQAGGAGEGR